MFLAVDLGLRSGCVADAPKRYPQRVTGEIKLPFLQNCSTTYAKGINHSRRLRALDDEDRGAPTGTLRDQDAEV
jgi:hypothetical protein